VTVRRLRERANTVVTNILLAAFVAHPALIGVAYVATVPRWGVDTLLVMFGYGLVTTVLTGFFFFDWVG